MINTKTIPVLLVLVYLFTSNCTKEFTPEIDLVDKPVVYAILNHRDTKHYVRISRSFVQAISGETIYAPVYHPDSLEVWLEIYRHDQRVGFSIAMTPEFNDKEPGIFDPKDQLVYSAELKLVGDSECRLTILNKQTGESTSSRCNLFTLYGFKPMYMSNLTRMDFNTLPNVFFYEVTCNFHYVEVSETDTVFKSLSYPVGTVLNGSKEADKPMSISLERPYWWNYLEGHITIKPNVTRYALQRPLEFKLLIGDQYLFDYRRSFSGNETIIHTGQSLSNIQGGFGLFCSYDEKALFNLEMLPDWYDKLAVHPQTKDLNFANHPWQ